MSEKSNCSVKQNCADRNIANYIFRILHRNFPKLNTIGVCTSSFVDTLLKIYCIIHFFLLLTVIIRINNSEVSDCNYFCNNK